jgi:hypothetical protein
MRMASFLVVPLLGMGLYLTSSLTTGCGSGGLSCENPGTGEQTCLTCINTMCSSYVTSASTDCSSYVSCLEACDCGDMACQDACVSDEAAGGTTCDSAAKSFRTCTQSMCKTQCPVGS